MFVALPGVSTSTPHVSGPVQVVLSQVPPAFSIVFSRYLLGRKYALDAWLGSGLVVVGALISALIPALSASKNSSPVQWSAVFALGQLPMGLLAILFEGFHKARGSDGRQITTELRMFWTNFILVGWLVLFAPLFSALGQPPFDTWSSNMSDALKCAFQGVSAPGDDCGIAGAILFGTVVIAAGQMHSQILLARAETGVLAALALVLSPFLADAIFPVRPLMGRFTEEPNSWDAFGAVVCLIGVLIFFRADRRDAGSFAPIEQNVLLQRFLREDSPSPSSASSRNGTAASRV